MDVWELAGPFILYEVAHATIEEARSRDRSSGRDHVGTSPGPTLPRCVAASPQACQPARTHPGWFESYSGQRTNHGNAIFC